ncbi:MAG: YCF48-related protein, partial [Dehalococcoidales bacterium]
GYAVGYWGIIAKTTDGGTNWTIQNSGTKKWLYSVYFTGTDTGYVVGDSGTILKTTNGGANWTKQISGTSSCLSSVLFTNVSTGYAVGEWGAVLNTTNGGTTWNAQNLGSPSWWYSICFTDSLTGYIVGSGTLFLKTITGGAQWNSYSLIGYYHLSSVCFTDAKTGYAVGAVWNGPSWSTGPYYEVVIKTKDAGALWTEIAPNYEMNKTLTSVCFTDKNTGYAVGPDGTILKTTNGGTEWTSQVSGTSNDLYSVFFTDKNTGYAVGLNGVILKTRNGGSYPVGVEDLSGNKVPLKIYPTPSSNSITIETSENSIPGDLSIFDLSGQEFIKQTVTKPSIQIDITTLPPGVYLVSLQGEKGTGVGRIIKQ